MYSSFALAQTNLTVLAETNFQNGILFYAQKHELFKKAGINVQIVAPHATNQNIFSQAEQHKSQVVFSSEFQFLTSKLAQQKSYKIIANTLFDSEKFNIVLPKSLKRFNYRSELDVFKKSISEIGVSNNEKAYFLDRLALFYSQLEGITLVKRPLNDLMKQVNQNHLFSFVISQTEYITSGNFQQSHPIINNLPAIVNFFQIISVAQTELQQNPIAYQHFLNALIEAQEMAIQNSEEYFNFLGTRLSLQSSALKALMRFKKLDVGLGQSLIISLEEKEQWLRQHNFEVYSPKEMNSLNWIETSVLEKSNPAKISIVAPLTEQGTEATQ